jgi:hypothetical protein
MLLLYVCFFLVAGLVWPSEQGMRAGLAEIIRAPGLLITDYMALSGPGAALFNAGLVGIMGFAMVAMTRTQVGGPTIAGILTMVGFALFGKTPANILPVIIGVFVYTRIKRESLRTYIMVAMFGTALGPLVSMMTTGLGLPLFWGVGAGILVGFVLPALAPHLLHNHQGHNLYNVGFTAGITATLILGLLRAFGYQVSPVMLWSVEYTQLLLKVFLVYFTSMILLGVVAGGSLRGYKEILRLPGALATDFTSQVGYADTFINMGVMGLLGLGYLHMVGGPVNGPTLGGIMTMVGFAAFGKHPRNAVPVIAGVFLASLVMVPDTNSPGTLLAALFGTTLAPVAGSFGPLVGAAAGFLHLATVLHVGVMHGGMNLYNNGLAGGFVATLVVALARNFYQKR